MMVRPCNVAFQRVHSTAAAPKRTRNGSAFVDYPALRKPTRAASAFRTATGTWRWDSARGPIHLGDGGLVTVERLVLAPVVEGESVDIVHEGFGRGTLSQHQSMLSQFDVAVGEDFRHVELAQDGHGAHNRKSPGNTAVHRRRMAGFRRVCALLRVPTMIRNALGQEPAP